MSETIHETAAEFFGEWGTDYDAKIRQCVPRYDEMLDQIVDVVPRDLAAGDVLELGTGSGGLTLAFLARFPVAALTTVDGSREMLELTIERVNRNFSPHVVEFQCARFEDLEYGGGWDLVISSISLHHVEDKAALFAKIHSWLRPGGALVFSDQMCGADDELTQRIWKRLLTYWEEQQMPAEDVKAHLEHLRLHDRHEPLAAHLDYLREAGFESIDCTWRHLHWSIVRARKPTR